MKRGDQVVKPFCHPSIHFFPSVDCSVSPLHNYGSEDQNKFLKFHTHVLAAMGDHSIPFVPGAWRELGTVSSYFLPFLDLKENKGVKEMHLSKITGKGRVKAE